MALDDRDIEHLARLARLHLAEDEREALKADLRAVLEYFEQLGEVDTEGVDALVRPVLPAAEVRPDAPTPSLPRERALALANAAQDGFIRVPRTIDEG